MPHSSLRLPSARLAAVLAGLLLAGCSGSDPAGEPAAPAGPDAGAAAQAAGAPGAGMEAEATAAVQASELRMAGTTPVGGCFGAGGVLGQCQYFAGQGNLEEIGAGHLRLEGVLSWTASTPATQALGILILRPYEGGGWTSWEGSPSVAGASPLQVDLDLSGIDESLAVWVTSYNGFGTPVAYVGAQAPQEFAFQGTLTSPA